MKTKYDVIVAGGGPSGCAAAIAAARMGADTLLIEKSTALGGMSTMGMVSMLAPYTDKEKVIYFSIAREILDRYKAKVGGMDERFDWVPISPEDMKVVYDEMVSESGAQVLFDSMVCQVVKSEEHIDSILVANKNGLNAYTAKVFIDCTGDADLAAFAGVPFETGDEDGTVQSATLCFALSNVKVENVDKFISSIHCGKNPVWERIVEENKYPLVENHCAPVMIGNNTVLFNAGHIKDMNPLDASSISQALFLGRQIAQQYHAVFKEYWPEPFENSELIMTAPALGVRESRRIQGMYCLTVEDYLERKHFPDEIAWNSYWIDSHGGKLDVRIEDVFYKPGENFGIPWRCLVPVTCENLLVAGRSICTERSVLTSVRVMPNCFATGEAAGIGAAIAAATECTVQNIPAKDVVQRLRENGAAF